jgi:hypothetical protein
VRAALGLGQVDEALYLQRQQEIQRDFQLRQMLLAEQMDQQSRLDSMLQEHQLKAIGEHLHEFPDLQQHYSRLLLNEQYQRQEGRSLFRERQIQQEELRRMALGQGSQGSNALGQGSQGSNNAQSASASLTSETNQLTKSQSSAKIQAGSLKDIAADSLAGNAVKKNETEKRFFAKPDDDCVVVDSKKRSRSNTAESAELDRKQKSKKVKKPAQKDESSESTFEEMKGKDEIYETAKSFDSAETAEKFETIEDGAEKSFEDNAAKPSAQALLDFAATTVEAPPVPTAFVPGALMSPPPHMTFILGTLGDLLSAGSNIKTTDDAASTLVGIKKTADWPDSESDREDDLESEKRVAKEKGDIIQLPGFTSILPQLPEEPEVRYTQEKPKKHKGLLDDDSVGAKPRGKSKTSKADSRGNDNGGVTNPDSGIFEYPYPIDTWWPSTTSVRRERKLAGESVSGDRFDESDKMLGKDSPFRVNVEKIQQKLSTEVTPGILEKVPHCRIHRMLMKKRKNPSAPELVYCFQVTELYPNDVMVCCSHCGTWRHTACGGHYKPYSVRESIEAPFVPVCDRCHEEEKIVRDHPLARMRIDRQRTEQIRRGLSTSAAMRQASFSKHGGTYKWPLGSVSATHIGGHTRSVHSRHDKAEKQWMDMATRLGRGYGYRPKERVKFRTKELERLLISVEDAGKEVDTELNTFFPEPC